MLYQERLIPINHFKSKAPPWRGFIFCSHHNKFSYSIFRWNGARFLVNAMLGGKSHQFLIVKFDIPLVTAEELYFCIFLVIDSPNIVFPGINRESSWTSQLSLDSLYILKVRFLKPATTMHKTHWWEYWVVRIAVGRAFCATLRWTRHPYGHS